MITVKFENPIGYELQTRQFAPGQFLRIGVNCRNNFSLGIGEPWIVVRFEMFDGFASLYGEAQTDLFGNAWVDWTLPNTISQATVRITAFELNGLAWSRTDETVSIPIGIGEEAPPIIIPLNINWVMVGGVALIAVLAITAYKRPDIYAHAARSGKTIVRGFTG